MPQLCATADLDPAIRAFGERLAAEMPLPRRLHRGGIERRLTQRMMSEPELRAALFRFVDVRPACSGPRELVGHLEEFLAEAAPSPSAQRLRRLVGHAYLRGAAAAVSEITVSHVARRFILGEDVRAAVPAVAKLWREDIATTVDLLGEATVSVAEAEGYFERCRDALERLTSAAAGWPERPLLEHDSMGQLARANLSVKVSGLTPELRPTSPERGIAGAKGRLRELLRIARDRGAHLHVDMESLDSREAVARLVFELLAEPEFRAGPSCGLVLQAYLVESPELLEEILERSAVSGRDVPFTVRLVKGAYWDHEVIQAAEHGWASPVLLDRASCDRNFELFSRRLLDRARDVRVAIASHNLRSVAHAAVYAEATGLPASDVEFQVLLGLGDDLGVAIARTGRRVRTYCPVGDLVAGMAYLVRRMLENTANDSFLGAVAEGSELSALLDAP